MAGRSTHHGRVAVHQTGRIPKAGGNKTACGLTTASLCSGAGESAGAGVEVLARIAAAGRRANTCWRLVACRRCGAGHRAGACGTRVTRDRSACLRSCAGRAAGTRLIARKGAGTSLCAGACRVRDASVRTKTCGETLHGRQRVCAGRCGKPCRRLGWLTMLLELFDGRIQTFLKERRGLRI